MLTESEKKSSKIGSIIGISILLLAIAFIFTGKFEIEFTETSLEINALYWSDLSISYEDIEDVTYSEKDNPGNRTYGYGSPTLLMGNFQNEEFGNYVRYSYPSCDSCIILKVNGKILVINGKEEETTKKMYEKLLEVR